ncbi:MAG: hypothetical protein ACRCTY_03455 [Candidatus Adiutrix sp.]
MAKLGKNGLKVLKSFHILTASAWLGGALSLVIINIYNPLATSDGMLYGLNMAGHKVDMWVVVNVGAIGCLSTGLIYGLFSGWGFFRHLWVSLKWLITVGAILTGTFYLGRWEKEMLDQSQLLGLLALDNPEFLRLKFMHLVGGILQLCVLIFAVVLSVFKPWRKSTKKI